MGFYEEEVEETCWATITFLLTVVLAAFGYRFFGPDQTPLIEEKPKVPETPKAPKVEETPKVEEKAEEPEARDSSDGSDFENISPSEIEQLVQSDSPVIEKVAEPVAEPVVEEVIVDAVDEEVENITEETEEDLVTTIDLSPDRVDVALDEYLGREQADSQIITQSPDHPKETLIEKKEDQVQEAELAEPIVEPIIIPVHLTDESSVQDVPVIEELPVDEDEIIQHNLADETLMTPQVTHKQAAVDADTIEDIIKPIQLNMDETTSETEPIEDIERKIENVAEQLIIDTLGQIQSLESNAKNVNEDAEAAGDAEENITPTKMNEPVNEVDEKQARSEQLTEIADLIAKTPGMAGEGIDVTDQAKMYLE